MTDINISKVNKKQNSTTVSNSIARALRQLGLTKVYGLPGEETEALLYALKENNIDFVLCRHEQGAAFMANVSGQLSGRPGVCLSTLGPGATNLVTPIADALLEKAPMIALVAQTPNDEAHRHTHQYLDLKSLMSPICKNVFVVNQPSQCVEIIGKAHQVAMSEPRGPVTVILPENIAEMDYSGSIVVSPTENSVSQASNTALHSAINLLDKSAKPLIICGPEVVRHGAQEALTNLSRRHNIPVVTTFKGKGGIDDNESTSLGTIGLGFEDIIDEAFDLADLVISVGYDEIELNPGYWNKEGTPTIDIRCNDIPFQIAYRPNVKLKGNIEENIAALRTFLNEGESGPFESWYIGIKQSILSDQLNLRRQDSETVFTVPSTIDVIRRAVRQTAVFISDVGMHKMWIGRNFPVYADDKMIISNGLASMGVCIPGALAAAELYPNIPVVGITGDGGFMMSLQELETAKRRNLSFAIVVLVDNEFNLISWKHEKNHTESIHTDFLNPDYVKLGESLDIPVYKPGSHKELLNNLEGIIKKQELAIVAVQVSEEDHKSFKK